MQPAFWKHASVQLSDAIGTVYGLPGQAEWASPISQLSEIRKKCFVGGILLYRAGRHTLTHTYR